jgi:signal transduction histidine kinase
LDKSEKELKKAYEAVAEVTALEERQRIAKEIHDTAGHSLTTVIMQTESAKLIMEKDPLSAKQKIVSANLQAKNALEELRNSVHLLSGLSDTQTLKSVLESVIHDSTDGTGIKIRSEIEELKTSPAKARFLCNTLKEGISNGLRHGNATAFWFELKTENDKIKFLLSDNGKGVSSNAPSLGFGLKTMGERVRAFGGEIAFHSEENEGFEIAISLPVDTIAENS